MEQPSALALRYSIQLFIDSKVAKAIISKLGVGGIIHLETRALWIWTLAKRKEVQVYNVAGEDNHRDIGANVLAKARFAKLLKMMNIK